MPNRLAVLYRITHERAPVRVSLLGMNPIPDPFHILRATWQPVALTRDLTPGVIRQVVLLGEELVLARTAEGILCVRDRCPHRGARFGIGRIEGDGIVCPYHGWKFDKTGQCTSIPSLGGACAVAKGTRLPAFRCCERYGFVWVLLAPQAVAEIPEIPEFEHPAWDYAVAEPMAFATGFRREIENYLDMSHFAFAHAETLGRGAATSIEAYEVSDVAGALQMDAEFPALATPGVALTKLQEPHHRTQRCHYPNVTTIRQSFADGSERVLVHVPSPVTPTSCRVFWSIACSPGFAGPPLAQQMQFATRVLDEDRLMCENQWPKEVELEGGDGKSVPADRLALTWRKQFIAFVRQAQRALDGSHPGGAHQSEHHGQGSGS